MKATLRNLLTVAGLAVVVGAGVWFGVLATPGRAAASTDSGTASLPWYDPSTGSIVPERVPLLIPVSERETEAVAGYIRREDWYPEIFAGNRPAPEPAPVYEDDGETIVGYLYGGVGFVGLDEDVEAIVEEYGRRTPVTTATTPPNQPPTP